ncbi:hypothetical protein CROQUDRAFT_111004 [Cronartium quercuum f. sp. fusiforme G11]|uniref:Uncharacterized protein n=1 Tax=Cronartium quercuum f. sp. fusiforme G11 TaxID=708437 RepID=A0A9P6N6L1_9BASI|nr:hypothetical protein CROQUDRAFT_111004 [Cronartium quercuum f. sp. fusiforme G11]
MHDTLSIHAVESMPDPDHPSHLITLRIHGLSGLLSAEPTYCTTYTGHQVAEEGAILRLNTSDPFIRSTMIALSIKAIVESGATILHHLWGESASLAAILVGGIPERVRKHDERKTDIIFRRRKRTLQMWNDPRSLYKKLARSTTSVLRYDHRCILKLPTRPGTYKVDTEHNTGLVSPPASIPKEIDIEKSAQTAADSFGNSPGGPVLQRHPSPIFQQGCNPEPVLAVSPTPRNQPGRHTCLLSHCVQPASPRTHPISFTALNSLQDCNCSTLLWPIIFLDLKTYHGIEKHIIELKKIS